jgi:hypothetical protein
MIFLMHTFFLQICKNFPPTHFYSKLLYFIANYSSLTTIGCIGEKKIDQKCMLFVCYLMKIKNCFLLAKSDRKPS